MEDNVSYGLLVSGLKLGEIAVDGGISTALTSPGKVMKDTIEINPGNDTDTDFKEEGVDEPFLTITESDVEAGAFDLGTFDKEVIADLCGGTVTGVGAAAVYSRPRGKVPPIYKTLELQPQVGDKWTYPRVKISAKLIGRFRNGELNVVRVNFKVMLPTKASVDPFYLGTLPAE